MSSSIVVAAVAAGLLVVTAALAAPAPTPAPRRALTVEEARTAVRLLDDAYRTILEETHHAYPTRAGLPVAASLVRDLQREMKERGWPASHFLGVQGLLMNPAHSPKDRFEKDAVQAMRRGETRLEKVEAGRLRVASVIFLRGDCFSCHWSDGGGGSKAAITWNVPIRKAP